MSDTSHREKRVNASDSPSIFSHFLNLNRRAANSIGSLLSASPSFSSSISDMESAFGNQDLIFEVPTLDDYLHADYVSPDFSPTPTQDSSQRQCYFNPKQGSSTPTANKASRPLDIQVPGLLTESESQPSSFHFATSGTPEFSFSPNSDFSCSTPPKTPVSPHFQFDSTTILFESDDDEAIKHARDVREGKRPEWPMEVEDELMDDLPETTAMQVDDSEEWYGLEYTLEISARERTASETSCVSFDSAGEYSKSRESWAAIHQGMVDPSYEEANYLNWKSWHQYMDLIDKHQAHRKGLEFKLHSKDMAWYYADEIKTRDIMYWQMEHWGFVECDVLERLEWHREHQTDPFHPRKKRTLGWCLKRSRSLSCIRELLPLPCYAMPSKTLQSQLV